MGEKNFAELVEERVAEACAHAAHETNRAYCRAIGDDSQLPWDQAEQWQRDSAIAGVRHAIAGKSPEQLHAAWCEHRIADGWVYGPVKDPAAKQHPCLVPYHELPELQRAKDNLFRQSVRAMALELGATIYTPINGGEIPTNG